MEQKSPKQIHSTTSSQPSSPHISVSLLRDHELLSTTKALVTKERSFTTKILECINEIESRRLHLIAGHSSLHEFLVKNFGYCDGAAHRRIAAARLLKLLPKVVAPALSEGTINLTTAALAQDFFVSEKREFKKEYSLKQKEDLLFSMASKSRRQCEEIFQRVSPERANLPKPERVRVLGGEEASLEILLTLNSAFQKKLTRVREILSHHPEAQKNYAALFELMADQLIRKMDPLVKTERKNQKVKIRSQKVQLTMEVGKNAIEPAVIPAAPPGLIAQSIPSGRVATQSSGEKFSSDSHQAFPGKLTLPFDLKFLAAQKISFSGGNQLPLEDRKNESDKREKSSRYIPARIKTFVYQRDQAQCSYVDPITGTICASRNFLHIDHIVPIALGGKTTVENCRLLCAQHNSLAALMTLGPEIMAPYLNMIF